MLLILPVLVAQLLLYQYLVVLFLTTQVQLKLEPSTFPQTHFSKLPSQTLRSNQTQVLPSTTSTSGSSVPSQSPTASGKQFKMTSPQRQWPSISTLVTRAFQSPILAFIVASTKSICTPTSMLPPQWRLPSSGLKGPTVRILSRGTLIRIANRF